MRKPDAIVVLFVSVCLSACNKSTAPTNNAAPAASQASTSTPGPDGVQQKLQEYAGSRASNCGTLDIHAAQEQLKSASDCAMQASQDKKAFLVSYEMPGMAVGVAGNDEGKLFTVQTRGEGNLSSGECPSQLRVASSGRVTCFAPGDMDWMSGSHAAGSMPSGMPNPHTSGTSNPHTTTKSN